MTLQFIFRSGLSMVAMTPKAADAWQWAIDKGIIDEQPKDIFETVAEQDVVTFCTSSGCVTFDLNDFVEI